ncbi:hypothetical protein L4D12_22555 [Photobacterium nomapromontoriensis]
MQIGLLAVSMTMTAGVAHAVSVNRTTEVSAQDVKRVITSYQVQHRVAALSVLYVNSDFWSLEFNLSLLSALPQEAVRASLVDYAITHQALDQAKADWLQEQAERKPMFSIIEQGDGYMVTRSAFRYGAKARGLVLRWQQILLAQAMTAQAEQGELVLSQWLAGDLSAQTARRDIFLSQLPQLSESAVAQLAEQFISDRKLMWQPDNAVLAALAAASGREDVYHLLWRRRSDQYSLAELNRLTSLAPQPMAIEQLMAATINPSLKRQAYRALISFPSLPMAIHDFLKGKLNEVDDGQIVATELARSHHRDWLELWAASSHNPVLKNNVSIAMAPSP